MKTAIQLNPGDRFGRLTLVEKDPNSNGRRQKWICKCNCGNIKLVRFDSLLSGTSESCGCLHRERQKKAVTKHGMFGTRTFKAYWAMIGRCTKPYNASWKDYGGRGIKISKEWMESFEVFFTDMGECPDKMSLDRKDTNGDYCKENCKWSTNKEQHRNRRDNLILEYKGQKKTAAEWAEILGIAPVRIYQRIKHGWSIEETMETPVTMSRKKIRK